jgi:hypothetical protein
LLSLFHADAANDYESPRAAVDADTRMWLGELGSSGRAGGRDHMPLRLVES